MCIDRRLSRRVTQGEDRECQRGPRKLHLIKSPGGSGHSTEDVERLLEYALRSALLATGKIMTARRIRRGRTRTTIDVLATTAS
jgi:hypothetical protein